MSEDTKNEVDWKRAIYIDFEGRAKEPASFLGVECEGSWSVDVLEPALWPAVERGHARGSVRASSPIETYRQIRRRAESEDRVVVAWSRRELEEIVATDGFDGSDKLWWEAHLVNAVPFAKRFARLLGLEVRIRTSSFGIGTNRASLASFMEALGYDVPKIHGPGNSASRILNVRRQLEKGRTFAELTAGAKKNWTNGLSHNFHDCVGMSYVMNELNTVAFLAPLYLKTHVLIDNGSAFIPAVNHDLMNTGVVHVITAWNPGEERPSETENETANQRLRSRIVEMGLSCVRAIGQDPDSTHEESSWAVVGLSDEEARNLGREFGQVAVFRLDSGTQVVLGCRGRWSVSRILQND